METHVKFNMNGVFQTDTEVDVVKKVWGEERVISRRPHGCKIMTVNIGAECSSHFHVEKTETFVLVQGKLNIELTNLKDGSKKNICLDKPYSSVTLNPFVVHKFYVPKGELTPAVFIEASTEDMHDDNYRFTVSRGEDTDNRGPYN